MRLDAESVCRVDENAGVLRGDDRFDYCCEIVYIGESLDTEQDVVESTFFAGRCLFWCPNNCEGKVSREPP